MTSRSITRSASRYPVGLALVLALLSGLLLLAGSPTVAHADTAPADPTNRSTPTTVSADPLPTAQIDGVAWTQLVVGNTVYVGGSFSTARPAGSAAGVNTVARANLLAYNITTGALISSWAPTTNGDVLTITASPDKSRIYIGGSFTQVNGQIRNRIAALDPTTGALVGSFQPKPDATVRAIVVTDSTVYFGGVLTAVNGVARNRLAAARVSDGALLSWAPNAAGGIVRAMALSPDGTKLLVGGQFTSLNGSSNPGYGLGAVDPSTGASLPWDANNIVRNGGPSAGILSMATKGDSVYVTGYTFGSGGNLEGIAKMNWADGTRTWVEDCHGDTYGAFPVGDVVYAASHAHYCGNLPDGFPQTSPWTFHWGTAFSDAVAGTLTADPLGYYNWAGNPSPNLLKWLPLMTSGKYTGQNQAGWAVSGNSSYVAYAGEFLTTGGVAQQGLVRYAVKSIAPNKIGPVDSGARFVPSAVSLTKGTVRLAWTANWDRDNENLTYSVIRNSNTTTPAYTVTAPSSEWSRPSMGWVDTGLTPGSTVKYRIFAKDPLGNEVRGDTVTVTVSDGSDPSAYAKDVTNDGASNYWRLGESSGSTVYDWAGFSDATAGSGVTRGATGAIAGDSNAASTFDGTSNGSMSNASAVKAPDTFSTELWFKTTSTSGGKLIGFGDAATGTSNSYDRHVYLTNDGKLTFGVYPGGVRTVTGAKSYNDGKWHHVVATLGSNGMVLYADGLKVGSRTDTTSGQPFSGYWRVGGDNLGGWPNQPSSNFLAADLDEVAVYPTVLSSATVKKHYTDAGGTIPGSVAPADAYGKAVYNAEPDFFWRLGETSGTTAVDVTPNQAAGVYNGGYTQGGASGVGVSGDSSASFDGSTGAVASGTTYDNPTTYSEELWFKTDTNRGGKLIGFGGNQFGNSGSYDRHVWMYNDGRLAFGAWTGQVNLAESSQAYNDNKWHYLVAQQGANGMQLYVDNVLVGTNSQTSAQAYTGYWRIGGDVTWGGASSNYFAGSLDEVAVYSRTLSAAEINDHFVAGGGTGTVTNAKPTAAFTSTVTNLSVAFDGSGSSDSDGTVASYAWDFGDGTTGTGASPTHAYATAKDYTVTLTVTDNKGATDAVTKTVTTVAANVKPTAAFTSTVTNLSVAFDGSGSSDSDGTVASYAWDFGDGTTGTGASPTHAYATAKDYTVTLTVTDNKGATDAVTKTVTTVAAPAGPLAADDFGRTVTGGWGSADTGGAWTRYGSASAFSVANGVGLMKMSSAGAGPRMTLDGVSSTNSDVTVQVSLDKIADGGGAYVSVGGRVVGGTDAYRSKLKVASNGATTLYLIRFSNGTETTLASVGLGSSMTYTAGTNLTFRLQVTGTSPTTVRAKVWKSAGTEPTAWTLSTTDSTAALQAAGGVSLVGYVSASSTNVPVTISFDKLKVVTP